MKVEILKSDKIKDFIGYCKKHIMEIDDSFLYDEDLKKFEPNAENPTCIVTDQQGDILSIFQYLLSVLVYENGDCLETKDIKNYLCINSIIMQNSFIHDCLNRTSFYRVGYKKE